MEINIKIGKKELIIFTVVVLVLTGVGLGTWLGIKTQLESEPDSFVIFFNDSEDLGDSRRISFSILSVNAFLSLTEINCDPQATFTTSRALPVNVSSGAQITIVLEGNFDMGTKYTFEFHIGIILYPGTEGEILAQIIIETITHRF